MKKVIGVLFFIMILLVGCEELGLTIVAYGNVASDGVKRSGSDNFTVVRQSAGYYLITLTDGTIIHYEHDIIDVTPIGYANERNAIWSTYEDGTGIGISIFYDGVKIDSSFSFIIYKLS